MRLINADNVRGLFDAEFKKTRKLILAGETHLDNLAEGFVEADRVIWGMPAVDAVVVTRCKDCKHSYVIIDARCCSRGAFYDVAVPDDFFCALAERKDGDSECLKSVQYGQSCRSRAAVSEITADRSYAGENVWEDE